MTIDERISNYAAAFKEQLTGIGNNVANVATDQSTLLSKIQELQGSLGTEDLSQENQDKLNEVLQIATATAANTKSLADSIPDSAPPEPPAEPVTDQPTA